MKIRLSPRAAALSDRLLAHVQQGPVRTRADLEAWWGQRSGVQRVELFRLLRDLADDGRLTKDGDTYRVPSQAPVPSPRKAPHLSEVRDRVIVEVKIPKGARLPGAYAPAVFRGGTASAAVAPPAKVMDLPAGARLACVEPGVPPRVTIEMGSGGDTVKIIGAPARVAAMADAYQRQVAAEVEATRKATPPEPSSTTAAPRPVAAPREEPVAVAGGELLTLSDAIAHAEEKGAGEGGCAANHRQLARWLRQLEESEKGCADLVREVVALRTRHDDTRLRFCSALNLSAQTEWNEILDRVGDLRDALATRTEERDDVKAEADIYYEALCLIAPDLRGTSPSHLAEGARQQVADLRRRLETPPAPTPRPRPTTAAKPTPRTDPRKVPVPGTVAARILASLRRGPKDTATLQARLDLPAPTVRGRLSELATGGWVAKGLNGAWEVIG